MDAWRARRRLIGFTPAAIPNVIGWYDFYDKSALHQDSAASVPVTSSSDPIGAAANKIAGGPNLVQATDANRLTYNESGGQRWAESDGTSDRLSSGPVPSDNHEVILGVRLLSVPASGVEIFYGSPPGS